MALQSVEGPNSNTTAACSVHHNAGDRDASMPCYRPYYTAVCLIEGHGGPARGCHLGKVRLRSCVLNDGSLYVFVLLCVRGGGRA